MNDYKNTKGDPNVVLMFRVLTHNEIISMIIGNGDQTKIRKSAEAVVV